MVGSRFVGTPEKPSSAPAGAEGAIRAVSELVTGARIVYPNQGVCRVGKVQSMEVAGQTLEVISMTREEDGSLIMVPIGKVPSIGLRHVADSTEIGDVFDLLASSFDDPELDWKVRHRMHGDLMAAGGVLGVAEVLKALQGLANLRPLPQKERERYDAARHLLAHEVAVALGVPEATAEDFIDLALIPPPGTVRPASKPRRLATLPPKTPRPRPAPRSTEDEDLEEFGLLDEEELAPLPIEEEGEAEEEAAEEKPAAKAAKPKKAKAPAKPRATKKKAAEGETAEAKPARSRAKKAAGTAPAGKPARSRTTKKAAPAEAATPAPGAAPEAEAEAGAPAEEPAPAKKRAPARTTRKAAGAAKPASPAEPETAPEPTAAKSTAKKK